LLIYMRRLVEKVVFIALVVLFVFFALRYVAEEVTSRVKRLR